MITWAVIGSAVIALVLVVLVQGKWTSRDSWFAAVFASAVMAIHFHNAFRDYVGHNKPRRDGRTRVPLYRVPEIVTRERFPDGGESDSTWRTQEARHVGSDTIAPGF